MNELLVGYARVSTEQQGLTAQRTGLAVSVSVTTAIYGLPRPHRHQSGPARPAAGDGRLPYRGHPGGDEAGPLARCLPDARDILDELTERNVKLSLGGSIHDPTDPVGRLLFNVLAMVAEFKSDLIRMRTREGMKVAKANGRLRGKQPKLKPNQDKHLLQLLDQGDYTRPSSRNFRRRSLDGVSQHPTARSRTRGTRAAIRPPSGNPARPDHEPPTAVRSAPAPSAATPKRGTWLHAERLSRLGVLAESLSEMHEWGAAGGFMPDGLWEAVQFLFDNRDLAADTMRQVGELGAGAAALVAGSRWVSGRRRRQIARTWRKNGFTASRTRWYLSRYPQWDPQTLERAARADSALSAAHPDQGRI